MKNLILYYIFSNKQFVLNEIIMTEQPNDKVILFYVFSYFFFNKSQWIGLNSPRVLFGEFIIIRRKSM